MSKVKDLDKVNQYTKVEDNRLEEKEEYRKVKKEVVKMDKENLPSIIESRKRELITEIIAYSKEHGLKRISYTKLYELMSSGNAYNRTTYSPEELFISFEVYKSITSDLALNNPTHFPSRQNFCNFIGISTNSFASWRTHDDLDLVEVVNRIDDYLTDIQLTMAQNNILNPGATMFRMKTEHGYVEPKEFLSITNEVNVDRNEMKQRLASVRNKTSFEHK